MLRTEQNIPMEFMDYLAGAVLTKLGFVPYGQLSTSRKQCLLDLGSIALDESNLNPRVVSGEPIDNLRNHMNGDGGEDPNSQAARHSRMHLRNRHTQLLHLLSNKPRTGRNLLPLRRQRNSSPAPPQDKTHAQRMLKLPKRKTYGTL